jgi:ribosome biogenesis GTPase
MQRTALGWDAHFASQVDPAETVSRVVAEERGAHRLAGDVEGWAEVTGRFRHHATSAADYPAVGDWVVVSPESGRAQIHRVLPRRSTILRAAAGRAVAPQVVAANVDTIFVVTSANDDLNPRRLERYLAMISDTGAVPVVVVNKIDLVEDSAVVLAPLRSRLPMVEVAAVSAVLGDVAAVLAPYLGAARTVALIGSSGVGKSTIVNRLAARDLQKTTPIREDDDRGRHTTTSRQLIDLPGGALLIDTPGMRELEPWADAGALDAAFNDVMALAAECRYSDCRHEQEPGCAVRAAVADGSLDADRVEHYERLQRELAFHVRKRDKAAAADSKRRWKQVAQAQKALYRDRDRFE